MDEGWKFHVELTSGSPSTLQALKAGFHAAVEESGIPKERGRAVTPALTIISLGCDSNNGGEDGGVLDGDSHVLLGLLCLLDCCSKRSTENERR